MPVVTSTTILSRIESGALRSTIPDLSKKMITKQLGNIRESCHLCMGAWSPQAEANLQMWLVGERAYDRRTVSSIPKAMKKRKVIKPGKHAQFRDRCRDLDKFLRDGKVWSPEGNIGHDRGRGQVIASILATTPAVHLGQTGLCAGHSAACLLDACPTAVLVSFERKEDALAKRACLYLDQQFPERHMVVYGDSQVTLPEFVEQRKPLERIFDAVFVDGGHSFRCAKSDLDTFRRCSRPGATVILDDFARKPVQAWTVGPTKAWKKMVADGLIQQKGMAQNMVWGVFVSK